MSNSAEIDKLIRNMLALVGDRLRSAELIGVSYREPETVADLNDLLTSLQDKERQLADDAMAAKTQAAKLRVLRARIGGIQVYPDDPKLLSGIVGERIELATQLKLQAESDGAVVAPFIWFPAVRSQASLRSKVYLTPDAGSAGDIFGQLVQLWDVPIIHWPTLIFGGTASCFAFLKKTDKLIKSYLALVTPKGIVIETTENGLRFELRGEADITKLTEHFQSIVANPDVQRMHKRTAKGKQQLPRSASKKSVRKQQRG